MKQTAVEWYAEQSMLLELKRAKGNISITQMLNELSNILDQAKEMEKKQMALCYKVGVIDGNNGEVLNFEQYYNKTFNK
jgi:hypothetical protein